MGLWQWFSDVRLGLAYDRKVRAISEALAGHLKPPVTPDRFRQQMMDRIMNPAAGEQETRAKDELWALMNSVPGLAAITDQYSFDREQLDELLAYWYRAGAVWRGNQFVPVSALTHPKTLVYALALWGEIDATLWASTLTDMVESRDWWE